MPRALPGFITIGSGIYVNLPPTRNSAIHKDESAPSVILIFGWFGALERHLQHYSWKYSELYPLATQIIIMFPGTSSFWTTESGRMARMKPVVEVLGSLGCLPSTENPAEWPTLTRPRILAHLFSDTGAFQLMFLDRLLSGSSEYPSVPLVSGLVLDSAPATLSYRSMHTAASLVARSFFALFFALCTGYFIHTINLILENIFRFETPVIQVSKVLHKRNPLPWMDSQSPRLYIFSKKDMLLSWEEIQQHASTAKELGLNVRCELFEESAHVSHMRSDPDRYWESIQDLWEIACRGYDGSEVKVVEVI